MSKIQYEVIKFNPMQRLMVQHANVIINEYASAGYDLTLRQIYYKFVARDLFPDDRKWLWNKSRQKWVRFKNGTKNAEPNYKWLGKIIGDGRLAGLIDWDNIVDRTRFLRELASWEDAAQCLDNAADGFAVNPWRSQPCWPEVWVEKDALVGVFNRICGELRLPLFSCRGYTSLSEMHTAAMRLLSHEQQGYQPVVFHFGDHDPSGMDMTRDIRDRLKLFMRGRMNIERLALNMDQIEAFNPPPSPSKIGDPRAAWYIESFGEDSWELDALEPAAIHDLVRNSVMQIRDEKLWKKELKIEKEQKEKMKALIPKLK